MAFSFDLGLAISAERYGAISAGPEQRPFYTPGDLTVTAWRFDGYFSSIKKADAALR